MAARPLQLSIPSRPSPSQTEVTVGESAARAIQYYAQRFGPYPYGRLALTQLPGRDSQGWPGLRCFFLSYAFLDQEQREQLHFTPDKILLQQQIPAHETAHQWWGDLITWKTYRDQWISEGLANYCSLMMLEEKNPAGFRQVMDQYRRDLVEKKNKDGMLTDGRYGPGDSGVAAALVAVTRRGYEAIIYGRGTWLFPHVAGDVERCCVARGTQGEEGGGSAEDPFVRALQKVRQRYEGQAIGTRELLDVFAEDLPPALRYEGKPSLDWFLEGWINGTALPKLELKAVKFTAKDAGSVVSGEIMQRDAPQDLVIVGSACMP